MAAMVTRLNRIGHSLGSRIRRVFTLQGWGSFVWPALILFAVYGLFLGVGRLECPPNSCHVQSFASSLWQVHAAVLAFTAIIVTVIVTIVSSGRYDKYAWDAYLRTSKFIPIISWNLWALLIEGLAALLLLPAPTSDRVYASVSNVALAGMVVFAISVLLTMYLYWRTLSFLDEGVVESLLRKDMLGEVHRETIREFHARKSRFRRLNAIYR